MGLFPPEGLADFTLPLTRVVRVTAVSSELAAARADRVLLMIGVTTGSIFFGPLATINANQGYVVNTTYPYIVITWADHGPLVSAQWSAISAGAFDVMVTEIFYRPTSARDRAAAAAEFAGRLARGKGVSPWPRQ